MQAGRLRQEGSSEERKTEDAAQSGNKEKEDIFDQFGNKVDQQEAEKDAKKLKKELKDLEKQLKDNKKKKILSQDEVWEIEDRIAGSRPRWARTPEVSETAELLRRGSVCAQRINLRLSFSRLLPAPIRGRFEQPRF